MKGVIVFFVIFLLLLSLGFFIAWLFEQSILEKRKSKRKYDCIDDFNLLAEQKFKELDN